MKKSSFKINGHKIAEGGKVFIIAEAGVNHNQKLDLALKLVDIAAISGADAVKFQTFKADQVVIEGANMASYQQKNLGKIISQREMLKRTELPEDFYPKIIKRCLKKGVLFLSTPHGGKESVELLQKFNVTAYKIGSGDLTNFILLEYVAKTKKPIILSSGMATLKEAKNAIKFIRSKGSSQIAMLHTTTNYPCPPEEVNLLAMKTLMEKLDVPVGYSDHTQGIQTATMAVTLGAAIYESHLTLNRNLPGPDHKASADPKEFKERVEAIRKAQVLLGNSKKAPSKSEKDSMIKLVRRSIVAARDLQKGHKLTIKDLEAKRPADGVSPIFFEKFLGKILKRDLKTDDQIKFTDIK